MRGAGLYLGVEIVDQAGAPDTREALPGERPAPAPHPGQHLRRRRQCAEDPSAPAVSTEHCDLLLDAAGQLLAAG